jgi:hypothetical protein
MKRKPYIIQIKKKNWVFLSDFNDEDYAKINAGVVSRSRKCPARVKFKGKVVYEVDK